VKYITLVNLLASREPFPNDLSTFDPDRPGGEAVPFPEYLTFRDVSQRMAAHVVRWLQSPQEYEARRRELRSLKERFAHPGATRVAAELILRMLASGVPSRSRPQAA
jgi:hypothetical protein